MTTHVDNPGPAAPVKAVPPMIEFARWYGRRGWRVLPLHNVVNGKCTCGNPKKDPKHDYRQGGKHPVHGAWQASATTDDQQITTWWTERPNANIGIATGEASGIFVLDVDPDSGGFDSLTALQAQYGDLPDTRWHETGSGGLHFFWNWPGFNPRNSAGKLGAGLDIRAEGGQVVAPPSVSMKGPYGRGGGPEPVDAPEWLLALLRPAPPRPTPPPGTFVAPVGNQDAYTQKAVQAECDAIIHAADGEQNHTINRAAFSVGTLVGAGALPEGEARETLLSAARAGNHPEGRAVASIESGLRAGMAQPRHPWPPPARADTRNDFSGLLIPEQAVEEREPPTDMDPEAWDEPLQLAAPPPLPLDVRRLGGIGAYANAVAGSLQMPVDIPAFLGLAAASVAIGGRRTVSPKPDWVEPVTLYVMPVAAPGEKKSPALGHMARPIYDEQARRRSEDRVAVARDQQERRIAEACVADAESKVIKAANPTKRMEARANLDYARTDLENLGEPKVLTQLIADDTTPEAATSLLAEQGERLGVLSTEGSFLGNVGGRYSKEANPEITLKGWSHEPHTVNRKNGPPLFLERPNLTLGLAVQPGLLTGMGETGDVFEARGLMGRFVYSMPTSRVGERTYDTAPIPDVLKGGYDAAITRMMTTVWDDSETREMNLAPDAQAAFRAFWEALEARYKNAGDLASIEGWANKLPGQVLRIAAVLTLFEAPDTLTVPGRVMVDVIALVPYMIGHAKLVADLMSAERQSTLGPARAVLAWLRKVHPDAPVSAAEVHRGVHGQKWCTSTEDVDQALALLERFGWVRLAPVPERRPTGRPPKPRFEVHPRALEQPR